MEKVVITTTSCMCDAGGMGVLKGTGSLKINNMPAVMDTDVSQTLMGICAKLSQKAGQPIPCVFAPSGKWSKTSKTMSIDGKSVVIASSELSCINGGKVKPVSPMSCVKVDG